MALHMLPHVALFTRHLRRVIVEIRSVDTALLAVEEPVLLLVESLEVRFVLLHHGLEMSLREASVVGSQLLLILLQFAQFLFFEDLCRLAFAKSLLSCHATGVVRLYGVSLENHFERSNIPLPASSASPVPPWP